MAWLGYSVESSFELDSAKFGRQAGQILGILRE